LTQAPLYHTRLGVVNTPNGVYTKILLCEIILILELERIMNEKYFEYVGTFLAAIGFGLLSSRHYFGGFIVGIISCLFLLILFKNTRQRGLFLLQSYFLIANTFGAFNA